MALDEYNTMLITQGHVCATSAPFAISQMSEERLSVDHDHNTGKVRALLRALLCNSGNSGNSGLGFFQDSPILLAEAIAYLARYGKA